MHMVGQRLKEARQLQNLTQKQLADLIGVKPSEISQYESGKRTPRWNTFNKILDALNVSADEMLGREVTVVCDEEQYQVRLSKRKLQILKAIEENNALNEAFHKNPSRVAKVLNNKIKNIFPEEYDN